jgi:WD40 repeat protein
VNACAVTPDGRHVVSASADQTLKVWELATHACRITHRGDASYAAVTVSATVIAGDAAGGVWFLELPPSMMSPSPQTRQPSAQRQR